MNCPVCQHTGVRKNDETCAQCGSEIGIFNLINVGKSQRNKFRSLFRLLVLIAFLLASGWLISYLSAASNVEKGKVIQSEEINSIEEKDVQIKQLIDQLNEKEVAIAELNERLELNEAANAINKSVGNETYHIVKYGETLWDVAVEHYGNGYKHEKIAHDNHLSSSDYIKEGDTLMIKD